MSSQLIQMRQRIRAIETIKKITHAMRIISMSLHARLKTKESPLATYNNELNALFQKLHNLYPDWTNPIAYPEPLLPRKPLILIMGSNKGLCGNFNTTLFHLVEAQSSLLNAHYIAIGKKAIDFAKKQLSGVHVASFDVLTQATLPSIAKQITTEITDPSKNYTSVIIFSNKLKNFFIQKPHMTQLIPFAPVQPITSHVEYIWEEKPEDILDYLVQECLQANLEYLLFESLLAEQAARFLSMDNATRNAKNILEETRLHYNKLRQAKITKELTELTGSF